MKIVIVVTFCFGLSQAIFTDCFKDYDCQVYECCTYDPRAGSDLSCKPRKLRYYNLIEKRDVNGLAIEELQSSEADFNEYVSELQTRDGGPPFIPCERFRYCRDNNDCRNQEYCSVRYNMDTLLSKQGICLYDDVGSVLPISIVTA